MPRLKAGGLSRKHVPQFLRNPLFRRGPIYLKASCLVLDRSGHSAACRSPRRRIEPARRRVAGSHFGSLSARIPSL